jgi:hypothetical protein
MREALRDLWRGHPERWALAGITAMGALLRFAWLSRAPADVDEAWTWYFVHLARSGRGFWQALGIGIDGPLFAAMNLFLGGVWGPSLATFRIPQAAFGTLALPLTFAVVGRMATRRLALGATLLAALSPFLVFYSKQARPYAQLLFFSLLWLYAAERTRERPGPRRSFSLGLTASLAVATHYYALVFLGSVHVIRLGSHLFAGRRGELRRELREALITLALLSPLLLVFAGQLSGLSMRYWQRADLDLAGVWTEEFLLLGSSLAGAGRHVAWLNLLVAGLVLAPYARALWRSPHPFREQPVLLVGVVMPLVGALLGRGHLFLPRGFIPSVPFLLAGWALAASWMDAGRWRRAYVALLMAPFLLSSYAVATSDPRQGFFRGREVMPEIVAAARRLENDYDLLVVHHWWLAQYVAFHHPHPERVHGLGMERRRQASRQGELAAVLGDVAALPRDARLLLMCNDLASEVDGRDAVIAVLSARRPLLRELPCREQPVPGESLLCRRLLLFGPESPRASGGAEGGVTAEPELR